MGDVGLADAPTAGPIPPARLFDAMAALTRPREADALDCSLVLSLAELTSAQHVVLARQAAEGAYVETIVHCRPDPTGGYSVQLMDVNESDPALKLLYRCLHQHEPQTALIQGLHRLVVPILCDDKVIGAMQVDSAVSPQSSRPLIDGFARVYANYSALLHESERDKLTGLYNRRSLDRQLHRMLQKLAAAVPEPPLPPTVSVEHRHAATPDRQQVWIAILDIDHFKRINDNYGHIYGDEVILLLAQQMRACFRRSDVLCRFGGEEFVILFNASDETVVKATLERFRQRMANYVFPQVGTVTVSIGYASVGQQDYPAGALDRADKALYYAKQNGRNCIHGYEALLARNLLVEDVVTAGSIDLF
ncbi:GGDEF domain-containing protein [Rhodanobacter sp. AS-Z3]|uniref:GGDEF domain-containing protein n=1 Tax=Rhodanobacter sp. AS-Z3 TaxID=3031330 RepID=UPI00247AF2B8|nr:GGDEF domain-containing protein [Rhodanobacter sp. AS-Z3]WEN15780.1 GGDEF domain-containing protein [Rhodanobacter sp. AS-Z3]